MKRREEIREVFGKGKRFTCKGAKLFILQTPSRDGVPRNRICFAFPRGYGKATERNRAKRLGREAYRNLKPRLGLGYDMILLAYPEDSGPTFAGRVAQMETLFARAGLL